MNLLLIMGAWASTACDDSSTAGAGLHGQVTDEQAVPIAGATVSVEPLATQVTTGSDGSFSVDLPADLPAYATLTYSAAGYTSVTRSILSVKSFVQLLPVELRAANMTKVSLPADGEAPATVTSSIADGGVTLSIAAGMLADANGNAVSGDANVELTYWHPQGSLTSMPTLLMAAQNNAAPVPLKSFGMVNIAADQNGMPLHVVDGGNITAAFHIPSVQQPYINGSGALPNLYVMDPNAGMWVGMAKPVTSTATMQMLVANSNVGNSNTSAGNSNSHAGNGNATNANTYTGGDPNKNPGYVQPNTQWPGYAVAPYSAKNVTVVYDPNTGVYTTTLPYFSAWNIDGELPPDNGGCVQGKVVNACSPGTGFAGQDITLWVLGFEQLKDYRTTTDSQSNYCINIGVSPYQASHNADPEDTYNYTFNYFVSGQTIDNTSECDPLPQSCRTCSDSYESWPNPYCNLCQLSIPGDPPFLDPNLPPPTTYTDTCNPKTSQVNVNACHFCPGTAPSSCTFPNSYDASNNLVPNGTVHLGCAQLDPIALRPPSCTCQYRGATCTNSGCCAGADGVASTCSGANTCVMCNKLLGEVCTQTDGCCDPTGQQQLICADNVCVPARDPSFDE